MVLAIDDPAVTTPLGQLLRLPVKFIKGKSDSPAIVVQAIAPQLQATGKNILPVVVIVLGEDKYQAVLNAQILEAARLAKLNFVWCIAINEAMQAQIKTEAGQSVQVNLVTASERSLCDVLEYAKSRTPALSKVNPPLVARAICDYRKTKQIKTLAVLTTLRCGIGKTKLPLLSQYLAV